MKIDGDSATFTVKIEAMGQETVLTGRATADGDSITGRYVSPMGTSEFHRATRHLNQMPTCERRSVDHSETLPLRDSWAPGGSSPREPR